MEIIAGLEWAIATAEVVLALPIAYLDAITIAAIVTGARHQRRQQRRGQADDPAFSFAFLIPAHNEEALLGALLSSLEHQQYPRELYTVCVVADNCTDTTAELARTAGAVVFERNDTSKRGKGYALSWLLEQMESRGMRPDAYVVIDADSVVSENFLVAMRTELALGARAIQARHTVLNPSESPSTALRWIAFTLVNHVRPLGRYGIGGSSNLSGNGMCLSRGLIERIPWRAFGLAEDYQYYLDIVTHGERVCYVPQAVVRSHMPTSFKEMRTQDIRWEAEASDASTARVALRLLRAGLRSRSLVPLDAAAELLVPPLSTLAAALLVVGAAAAALGTLAERRAAAVLVAGFALYIASAFFLLRPGRSTYRALLYAPAFMAWKLWVQLVLRHTKRHKSEWVRTKRPDSNRARHSLQPTQVTSERN